MHIRLRFNSTITVVDCSAAELVQLQAAGWELVAEESKAKTATAAPAKVVDINDYAPKRWGKTKDGYTALRKRYAYDKCRESGVDFDKAIYEAASEEFKAAFYGTLK